MHGFARRLRKLWRSRASISPEQMRIVQEGLEKEDLLRAA
jgi:hypothetical protein